MDGGFNRSFAPVKVGEEINVKIEAVGEKGDGIAKVKGFVLFIPNVKEGDEVRIRITKVLRKVGFAEVIGPASASTGSQEVEEVPSGEDTENFGEEAEEVPDEVPLEEEQ